MKLKIVLSGLFYLILTVAWAATCQSSAINACVNVPKPSESTCKSYHEELYTIECSKDGSCLRVESQNCGYTGFGCARIGSLCHRVINRPVTHKKSN